MNRKQQFFKMEQLFPDPLMYDMILIGGQETKFTQKSSVVQDFSNHFSSFGLIPIGQVTMWEMFLVGYVKIKHVQHLKNQ